MAVVRCSSYAKPPSIQLSVVRFISCRSLQPHSNRDIGDQQCFHCQYCTQELNVKCLDIDWFQTLNPPLFVCNLLTIPVCLRGPGAGQGGQWFQAAVICVTAGWGDWGAFWVCVQMRKPLIMLMAPAAHLYPALSFNIQMLMLAFLNKFGHVLRGMQSLIPQADKKPIAFFKLIYPILCILSQGRSLESLRAHSGDKWCAFKWNMRAGFPDWNEAEMVQFVATGDLFPQNVLFRQLHQCSAHRWEANSCRQCVTSHGPYASLKAHCLCTNDKRIINHTTFHLCILQCNNRTMLL